MSAVPSNQQGFAFFRAIPTYKLYVWAISLLTLVWLGYTIRYPGSYIQDYNFWLLIILVSLSQYLAETLPIAKKTGITYSISPALIMATVPLFGIGAAILMEMVSMISVSILQQQKHHSWSRRLSVGLFNIGMGTTSIFFAAYAYHFFNDLFVNRTTFVTVIIWLFAAVLYIQINLLIIIGVLRLQNGNSINPLEMWQRNIWASVVNVTTVVFGGGMLSVAIQSFGWIGLSTFILPIFSSAYAFRVYVTQTKNQMANLESIIAERTEELERLNQEKDDFLAVLTHDMKSPLMSIGMYASMLQQNPQLIQAKPHTISNILRAQATLNDLVNNIVDLENLKADSEMALDLLPFDINELVEYVTESLQPQAQRSQLKLFYKPHVFPVTVVADRLKIERVLTNLISNAVKYTQKNGLVDVRLWLEPDKISIAVIDTGYGIPAAELPHIFERFRRVKQHRRVALGTGLGLAIAKLIAEAHNGTIEVESEENVGSTFTLTLPTAESYQRRHSETAPQSS